MTISNLEDKTKRDYGVVIAVLKVRAIVAPL
jgi:hypothetical protein